MTDDCRTNPAPDTLRIFPEQWLDPIEFRSFYSNPEKPFEIDLGCGKGRFLLARARKFPDTNFLGIDRLLNRIKRIDRKIVRQGLFNTRVLRADGYYTVSFLVPPQSVDTYYVFYPDPWPKGKHHHNRIFNECFMDALARTLKPGGKLHAATDHLPYFEDIYQLIRNDSRFEETETFVPSEDEVSDFELIFAHKTPGRCSFVRKP
ncbi:MAG: tRNA (guanosine(46)-N7)-methyltransferase TrmB [Kiritimatiellaceae bacterium]|nr:tRNA (guanosine(46)-N7)-methyltransferase TrmB [Kiritimatiellaceae bacterium]